MMRCIHPRRPSRAPFSRARVFVFVVVFAPRRQSSTRVMPTDAAPTCVAYDDTRTACIIGTATGELVFRDRASSIDTSGTSPRSKSQSHVSTTPWTRETSTRATDGDVGIVDVALCDAECGRRVAACAENGEISFWDVETRARDALAAGRAGRVDGGARARQIAFAPRCGSLLLAAACDDGVVRFYEPRERCSGTAWEASDAFESARPGGRATALAWRRASESGRWPLLAVGISWPRDGRHTVCVLARDTRARRWRVVAETEHDDDDDAETKRLAWSATTTTRGAINLVAARGSTCVVYECTGLATSGVGSMKTIGRLRHPGVVMSCDWNASGSVVATTCEDGVVRLWSANLKDGTWCEHAVAE
jgi:WD40 repeat protein